MKKIELPVVFPVNFAPAECRLLLFEYMTTGSLIVKFCHKQYDSTEVEQPPHGTIQGLGMCDNIAYTLKILYDESLDTSLFEDYRRGREELLCLPTISPTSDAKPQVFYQSIQYISIVKQSDLEPNKTYDGIHDEYRCVKE